VPLTPVGREQAARAAVFLRARFAPARIVSSPMTRAHQTAEIIAAALALPIELEPDLRERSLGDLHGHSYDAVLTTPGYGSLPYQEWRPPAGETLIEVRERAGPALAAIARGSIGRDVVVVSHAGAIRSCWAHVEGDWHGVPDEDIPNCSVLVVPHDGVEFGEPELLLSSS